MMKKAILIVLDSAGIGQMPDAARFGDEGADTFGHLIEAYNLHTPNMDRLGLRNIEGTSFFAPLPRVEGCFGRAAELSNAKDTTSGHWEIAGLILDKPFRTYPNGFPRDIMEEFEQKTGRGTLGNCTASGTEIIQRLGDEHVKTGKLIVYTSADSVFQIAAHEDVVPLPELYRCCQAAREMLVGDRAVGRIIARPFTGKSGNYTRTENRRDFALPPERDTVLDGIAKAGMDVMGIGKIEDIFCRAGITKVDHTKNNHAGIDATIAHMGEELHGLIFTNLVDFDMLYGHRNDAEGYARALEYFDQKLPGIISAMGPEDLLIITADHGCDPTFPGTDHTREYIPILAYGPNLKRGVNLGTRGSFADIGATVYDFLGLGQWEIGTSFMPRLTKEDTYES